MPYSYLRTAGYEFLLTTGFLFTVVTTVRWLFAADSPVAPLLPGPRTELVATGLVFGAIVAAVMGPSMRHNTAGHLSPAVTVGLWLLRVFPGRAVAPFVVAQLAGSATGAALGRLAWGEAAEEVRSAAVGPAAGWSAAEVFTAEGGAVAVMTLLTVAAVARPRLSAALPALTGGCVAAAIIFLGPLSGGAANPARQFGPALVSGRTDMLWAYLLAPVAGAALAVAAGAWLRRTPPGARRGWRAVLLR
ncbi:aquaporin [Streptomyces hypolithicus]